MTDTEFEVTVDGSVRTPAAGWELVIDDPDHGIGRLIDGERAVPVVVEGAGPEWTVTLAGRRIPVTVRTWRERLIAEAETTARVQSGPAVVTATLPGLIVAIAVGVGDEVADGETLLTIEAMKMQNEVRAPRAGRVIEVAVTSGQAVATGTALVRIE